MRGLMEYLPVVSDLENERNAVLQRLAMQHPELWENIPEPLQNLIFKLESAATPKLVTCYDEIVTCHSLFVPLYTRGLSGGLIPDDLAIHGDWQHLMTINQTGETTGFSTTSSSLSWSAEDHLKTIKSQHGAYLAAQRGFGFFRLSTPHKAILKGREPQALDFNKGPLKELLTGRYYPSDILPRYDRYGGLSGANVRTQGPEYSDQERQSAMTICQKILNTDQTNYGYTDPIFFSRVGTILIAYGFPLAAVHEVMAQSAVQIEKARSLIEQDHNQLIAAVAPPPCSLAPAWFSHNEATIGVYEQLMFPEKVKNFILAAKDADTRQHRLSFVHQSYALIFGESLQQQIVKSNGDARLENILTTLIGNSNNSQHHMNNILRSIDNGVYPYHLLPQRFDLLGVYTKKEVMHGLTLYGENATKERTVTMGMGDCIALAKLPDAWLRTPEGVHLLDLNLSKDPAYLRLHTQIHEAARLGDEQAQQRANELFHRSATTLKVVMGYLRRTGIKMAVAQQAGDKETIKSLTADWAWFTKHPEGVVQAVLSLDEKYNPTASLKDYPRILQQFSDAIIFRAVSDFEPARHSDVLGLDGYNVLSVDYNELDDYLASHYESNLEQEESYWDEDIEGWVEPDPVSFYDTYNRTHHFNEEDLAEYITKHSHSIRDVLDNNDALHKEYNKTIQQMNEYSSHQISWTPFLDAPVVIDDRFLFQSISDRLSLLQEGATMGHCVFSYIGNCTSGRSVILSLRDSNNPEERIATVELGAPEDDDNSALYEIKQCYGKYNNAVSHEVHAAAKQFVEAINNGTIPHYTVKGDDGENLDYIRDIRDNPYEHGAKATAIPYDTDAVYEAYALLEKYLPGNAYHDLIHMDGQALGYLTEQSEFFTRGIYPMKALEAKYQLPIDALVAVKGAIKAPWFDSKAFDVILPVVHDQIQQCLNHVREALRAIPTPDGKVMSGELLKQAQSAYQDAARHTQATVIHDFLTKSGCTPGSAIDISHLLLAKKSPAQIIAKNITPALASSMTNDLTRVDYRIKLR